MPAAAKNRTGVRYGRLIALERTGTIRRNAVWKCQCDCGAVCEVNGQCLERGNTQSCGCLRMISAPRDLWDTYTNMIKRCTNPTHEAFHNYGGRGIQVCARWMERVTGYDNFYADMGPKPSADLALDREDNDGNYEPGNCRWATRKEQAANRRKKVTA